MSEIPRWDNLPAPRPTGQGWTGFSVDPRRQPGLRASDADRAHAAGLVAAAYAEGRLDPAEYERRSQQASGAVTLGDLTPLVGDLVIQTPPDPGPSATGVPARGGFPLWWLRLALMLNVIWVFTCVASGELLYYWPMWPMLGTAIPAVIQLTSGGGAGPESMEQAAARHRRRAERRVLRWQRRLQRRELRRAYRDQRRGLNRGVQPPGEDLR